jgi:hypothetical protein
MTDASVSGNTVPQSLSDFTCFGVMVSGTGITADPALSCPNTTDSLGTFAGLAATSNGEIDISVPQGTARKITIFAVQSQSGACPAFSTFLAAPAATRWSGYGPLYTVGSATTDVADNVTVQIKVAYDPSNPQQFLSGCAGGAAPSPTPSTTPNISNLKLTRSALVPGQATMQSGGCNQNAPCVKARVTLESGFKFPPNISDGSKKLAPGELIPVKSN